MKTNGQMNHGGSLLPQYADAWARCFVRFIQAYADEGVPVWGVSVQNEPMATQRWDSCIYSAQEERDFVRDHLGPALALAGLSDVRIVIWDHNRDLMVERASVIYGDPEAAKYVWGTGFHWYGEDCFDHVQRVHDAWPDKQLLFTEGCQEGGPHTGSWALGERYARSMIQDLNHWTVGWIDWNLLLDDRGGPNHVGNFCSAPILADLGRDVLAHQSSFDYIGHFARFIRPGARRVLCAATRADLEATAFVNPDGVIATVVMNRTEDAQRFALVIDGAAHAAELPARSIATFRRDTVNQPG
jgi:glucosylceramidase